MIVNIIILSAVGVFFAYVVYSACRAFIGHNPAAPGWWQRFKAWAIDPEPAKHEDHASARYKDAMEWGKQFEAMVHRANNSSQPKIIHISGFDASGNPVSEYMEIPLNGDIAISKYQYGPAGTHKGITKLRYHYCDNCDESDGNGRPGGSCCVQCLDDEIEALR